MNHYRLLNWFSRTLKANPDPQSIYTKGEFYNAVKPYCPSLRRKGEFDLTDVAFVSRNKDLYYVVDWKHIYTPVESRYISNLKSYPLYENIYH